MCFNKLAEMEESAQGGSLVEEIPEPSWTSERLRDFEESWSCFGTTHRWRKSLNNGWPASKSSGNRTWPQAPLKFYRA